jgi:hypothetical protein
MIGLRVIWIILTTNKTTNKKGPFGWNHRNFGSSEISVFCSGPSGACCMLSGCLKMGTFSGSHSNPAYSIFAGNTFSACKGNHVEPRNALQSAADLL